MPRKPEPGLFGINLTQHAQAADVPIRNVKRASDRMFALLSLRAIAHPKTRQRRTPVTDFQYIFPTNPPAVFEPVGISSAGVSVASPGTMEAELSPHLEFVDMGGHGYATVRLSGDEMRTEFVWIPRPIRRSDRPDGVLFATGWSTRHRSGNRASSLWPHRCSSNFYYREAGR